MRPAAGYARGAAITVLATSLLLLASARCGGFQRSDQEITGFLPREADVPGWKETGSPVWHSRKSMALILGEKSPLYLAYGAEEMAYAEYSPLSGEPRTIRVTVFRMGSPLGAFGVLSRERGFRFRASPHISPFGDSYAAPGGLYFRHGNLYVAVTSSRSNGTSIDECREFAHIVTGGISAPRLDLPEFTALFGSPGSRNDLVYFAGRHPDVPAFQGVYARARQFNGETRTVIFARRGTKAEAMRDFAACMENPGLPLALSGAGEYRTALGRRADGKYVVLAQSGEWIFGVSDAPDMPGGERIVRELHSELVSYLLKNRE